MIEVEEIRNLHDAKLYLVQHDFVVGAEPLHMIMLILAESEARDLRAYFDERGGRVTGPLGE